MVEGNPGTNAAGIPRKPKCQSRKRGTSRAIVLFQVVNLASDFATGY